MSVGKTAVRIPLRVNKATGRESLAVSMFSEKNCGPCTRQYAMVIEKRDDAALRDIVAGATTFVPCGMDAVSEEGSFQYEEDVGDLIAALCKSYCCLCTLLTVVDRIPSFGHSLDIITSPVYLHAFFSPPSSPSRPLVITIL